MFFQMLQFHFVIFILQEPFGNIFEPKVNHSKISYRSLIGVLFKDLVVLSREPLIRREIANIIALPLLPSNLVRPRFKIIAKCLSKASNLFDTFIKYINRTYLNNIRFKIQSWNHYDHLGTRPRTNSHLEGTHRQFKTYVSIVIIVKCKKKS